MPIINIQILDEGVTEDKKSEVIRAVTNIMIDVLGKKKETTFVVINEVKLENWGYCGESVSVYRKQKSNAE